MLGFAKLIRELKAENFDAALLFQNAFQAAWMAWRARIPLRIGYACDGRGLLLHDAVEPPLAAAYGHQVYYYLQLLFRAGMIDKPESVEEIRIRLADEEKTWAAKAWMRWDWAARDSWWVSLREPPSVRPSAGCPNVSAGLADRLIGALNADVLIFGSAAERPLAEEIASSMKHTPAIVAGETSLRQLLALMAGCRLIVANDSGPMHLAAGLGIPLVAILVPPMSAPRPRWRRVCASSSGAWSAAPAGGASVPLISVACTTSRWKKCFEPPWSLLSVGTSRRATPLERARTNAETARFGKLVLGRPGVYRTTSMTISKSDLSTLLAVVERFPRQHIIMLGDLVADESVYGEIVRVSREAPVLILKERERNVAPGGGGNAANNLAALGARVTPIGVVGDDESGDALIDYFRERQISTRHIVRSPNYLTPTKTRILGGLSHWQRQQVVRIDREPPS